MVNTIFFLTFHNVIRRKNNHCVLVTHRFSTFRQPGLLCTPRNFAQSSKLLEKNIFWYQGYL
jgi:hypothetical protein